MKSLPAPVSDTLVIAHLLAVRGELSNLQDLVWDDHERALLIDSAIRPVESALHELGWESPAEPD